MSTSPALNAAEGVSGRVKDGILLDLTTTYFSNIQWDVLPNSEGVMLVYAKDVELYYDFPSLGSIWRWWREVYKARRQFTSVIQNASSASKCGHDESTALIEWLRTEKGWYPPLMSSAYYDPWPHSLFRGWLAHAATLEGSWHPGIDPLDVARAIADASND